MTAALIFPGQGSQAVGMGLELARAFPSARAVFEEVDAVLKFSLSRVIWEGPEDVLMRTENAQPALLAVSVAFLQILTMQLEERGLTLPECVAYVAGHSLGEYSALVAAGALSLTDAARLLRIRGRAMQECVPPGCGVMAAILGLEFPKLRELLERSALSLEEDFSEVRADSPSPASEDPCAELRRICQIANDNAPGQIVISGHKDSVAQAIELAKEAGARRALLLPVSGPFHSCLMAPAAQAMQEPLANTAFRPLKIPLISNVSAKPVRDVKDVKASLLAQVTGRVRWRESMVFLRENGVTLAVEIGAGRVLTGLLNRTAPEIKALTLNDKDLFPSVVAALSALC